MQKPNLKILILAIIVVLAITGGIFWWQKDNINKLIFGESPKACTQEAKLCPDGSYVGRTGPNCEFAACPQDQTAGWQTYRNEEYGFEVKYPKEWKFQEYKDTNEIIKFIDIDPVRVYSEKEMSERELPFPLVNINFEEKEDPATPLSYEDRIKQYSSWSDIILKSGEKAKKKDEIIEYSPNPYYSNKHNIVYRIGNYNYSDWHKNVFIRYVSDREDKYLDIFDQILSTFKFIE